MNTESVAFKTTLEIVKQLPNFTALTPDAIIRLLESTFEGIHYTIQRMNISNNNGNNQIANTKSSDSNSMSSIATDSITCLVCNAKFRMLTSKHLATHGLTKEMYKEKFGLPYNIKLVCKHTADAHRSVAIKHNLGNRLQASLRSKIIGSFSGTNYRKETSKKHI